MFVTTHVFAGALIGLAVPRPIPAFAVGFASHMVLDALPHWGPLPEENWLPIARTDGLAGLGAIAACAVVTPRRKLVSVLAGIAGSTAPDLDKPGRHFFGRSPFPGWFDRFHVWIQHEAPTRMAGDIALGAALGATTLAVLRSSDRRRPAA